ncbi:MAG: PQQ-binding-like beta-propeller repeat protein [Lewinellaceae bacterium]|nr:PQQ-binding-like beta-propeller repeat protein [Lewinellaceae bacterium]
MNVFPQYLRPALILLLFSLGAQLAGQSFRKAYAPDASSCSDFTETADGGFLMVGGIATDNALFLQRTDQTGNIIWAAHQNLNGARGIAVCAAPDGGFAVLCENYFDGTELRNLVLKIDGAGVTQWQKVLENPTLPNGFRDIVATTGGGYAVAGDARTFVPVSDSHIQLLRLDETGNILWTQTLGDPNAGRELALGLVEMANGDLVVAGERRSAPTIMDGSDLFMARTDAQGTVLWQREYNKPDYQSALDFKVDANGNLLLFGETKQSNPAKAAVLKTTGDGTEIWFREPMDILDGIPSGNTRYIRSFILDGGGNVYIPFLQINDNLFTDNLNLFKLSAAGDSAWTRESNLTDLPLAARYTTDNQFALVGRTGTDEIGENAVLLKTDWNGGFFTVFSTLQGSVFWDENLNCTLDNQEPVPPNIIVKAVGQLGDTLYTVVSPAGSYAFNLNPDTYTITARPLPGLENLWTACDTPVVVVPANGQVVQAPPIGIQSTVDCPYLEVELVAGLMRRCTSFNYYINYCNNGTQTATNATVQLTLDPLCDYVNSTLPLVGVSGNILTFDLGDLAPGHCDNFKVQVMLSCGANNGQTICAEAHIYPDSSCLPPDPLWDGSHVEVQASCNGTAEFTITNSGAGDMNGTVNYVIIEDQIMYMQGSVQLDSGADSTITIANPTGNSYYIRSSQRPGHPGNSMPAAAVDLCNGQSNGTSLAQQLALNTGDPFLDIHCGQVVGSYDPNDKRGFPLGWRDEHYLEVGQEVEYMIRFQNTGNDTAFLVVIRDDLPAELDPATVRPGPASHPYKFQMSGSGMLRFTFENILLPDSTTNEPESHGFVTFRVAQRPDLPLGTILENTAAIDFDFNEPVITNTWFHTIGYPLLTFTLNPPTHNALDLRIAPNPAISFAEFQLTENDAYRFSLYDATGQLVQQRHFSGTRYRFERGTLPAGLYFFRMENMAGRAAGGKLMLK